MTATLKTVTLGCKVNQYETQFVREGLEGIGFREATKGESADVCIVNTCTVTGEGDSKSRQIIRRLHREQPEARIIVMGCYATRAPDEISALPGVAEVVTDKRELPDLLSRFGVIDIPTGISGLDGRSRAYVKVQDGCLLRCSYCIIPAVRPQMYSRPLPEIVEEVHRIADHGYKEVVLTGVHLGHFGVDQNQGKAKSEWVRLAHLLRHLMTIPGDLRIRLSSIEATEITRELIDVMAEFPDRICPHFHVCLQSGSEEILRRMKRRWGARRFIDRCRLVKETLDRPALTTDVIVGFPGETEAHFQETLSTCREVGFSKIHVFPFSARRGTPAAEMSDQIQKSEKQARVHRVTELETEMRDDYFRSLLNTELTVLVEKSKAQSEVAKTDEPQGLPIVGQTPQVAIGTSCRYAPVEFETPTDATGELIKARAVELLDGKLRGTQLPSIQPPLPANV